MKKIMFIVVAAIIVMATITGCTNATTTKNANSSTTATTTGTIPPTTTGTIPTTEKEMETDTETETETDTETDTETETETDTETDAETETETETVDYLEYYFSYFREQKAFLESSIRKGQYKAFKAHDLSKKYGLREFKPWGWTDNYGHHYKWPVLVDEGTFDECLLIESEEGDLIKFTYRSQMLRRMNLGHLYDD